MFLRPQGSESRCAGSQTPVSVSEFHSNLRPTLAVDWQYSFKWRISLFFPIQMEPNLLRILICHLYSFRAHKSKLCKWFYFRHQIHSLTFRVWWITFVTTSVQHGCNNTHAHGGARCMLQGGPCIPEASLPCASGATQVALTGSSCRWLLRLLQRLGPHRHAGRHN